MCKKEIQKKKVMCDRCGEMIYRRNIKIENLSKYDTSSKEAYIQSLMSIEGADKEQATSWSEHGLYEMCQEKFRNCPKCGIQLKTWRASICVSCGANFDSWYS